jgi:diguanylate cyclase
VAVPPVVLAWAARAPTDLLVRVTHPALALYCLFCIWALQSRRVPIETLEKVTLGVFSGFALGRIAIAFFSAPELPLARAEIGELTYLVLVVVFVLAHLTFETRTALRLSLLVYGAVVAITLSRAAMEMGRVDLVTLADFLVPEVLLASVLAMVSALAHHRTRLARADATSRALMLLAHTDALTGLANRRQLQDTLTARTEEARRYDRGFAVVLLDIDHFKEVNDTSGHAAGDQVLTTLAQVLQQQVRAPDLLGRWGGEEFLIVAPETNLAQAAELAERCRRELATHTFTGDHHITASFGCAAFADGDTSDDILRRADKALYEAKVAGRNRVRTGQHDAASSTMAGRTPDREKGAGDDR